MGVVTQCNFLGNDCTESQELQSVTWVTELECWNLRVPLTAIAHTFSWILLLFWRYNFLSSFNDIRILSIQSPQKTYRSVIMRGIRTGSFLVAVEANMYLPTKLGSVQEFFSLNFEANNNPSIQYVLITKRSAFTRGIRKWLLYGGWGNLAHKWWCVSDWHHSMFLQIGLFCKNPSISDHFVIGWEFHKVIDLPFSKCF